MLACKVTRMPGFHLCQCPFLQMIDTDMTLLPDFIKLDLARSQMRYWHLAHTHLASVIYHAEGVY
jgi:hypothetical protein